MTTLTLVLVRVALTPWYSRRRYSLPGLSWNTAKSAVSNFEYSCVGSLFLTSRDYPSTSLVSDYLSRLYLSLSQFFNNDLLHVWRKAEDRNDKNNVIFSIHFLRACFPSSPVLQSRLQGLRQDSFSLSPQFSST